MVAVAWMAAGCISPSIVLCGDGLACPANTRCDVAHNRCVTAAADAACAGHAEGDSCILAGALGTCIAGACAPATFEWKESAALAHPSARADHAMATLGDEVVLFGGEVSVGSVPYLADTWQWDGRLWSELAPAARPPGRANHAMATLGNNVILFGGDAPTSDGLSSTIYGDTWQWDGTTWTALAPPTSPPARTNHAMATLGNKVVLFGGTPTAMRFYDPSLPAPAGEGDTWTWDGTTWTELAPSTSPPARMNHAMATLGNKVILFGGEVAGGLTDDTWEWDGTTWAQLSPPTSPPARMNHTMATVGNKVILFGGDVASGPIDGVSYPINDSWEWDGTTWTELSAWGPSPGSGASMASRNGMVLLFGGNTMGGIGPTGPPPGGGGGAGQGGPPDAGAPSTGTGTTGAAGSPGSAGPPLADAGPVSGTAGAAAGPGGPGGAGGAGPAGGTAGVSGGAGAAGGACAADPDCATGFTCIGGVCTQGSGGSMGAGGMGGASGGSGPPSLDADPVADTWEWNGESWLPRAVLPPTGTNVSGAGATSGAGALDNAMVSLGGKAVLFGSSSGTWEWDGVAWSALRSAFTLTSSGAPDASAALANRFGYAMTSLGSKIVLFGGMGAYSCSVLADQWEWDGANWQPGASATSPPARAGHAMATLGSKVVLFGGTSDGSSLFEQAGAMRCSMSSPPGSGEPPLGDTWEWDGATWTNRTPGDPAGSPPARWGHAMVTVGSKIVLFGGQGAAGLLDDTWEWDGATWTQLAPPTSPPARRGHALSTINTSVVLFGGSDAGGSLQHDTWVLTGETWSQLSPLTYPAARANHVMANVAGKVVLFGGTDTPDTWLLDVPLP